MPIASVLLGFITSFLLAKILIVFSRTTGIALDYPETDTRRIHKEPTPRVGGIVLLCAFLFTLVVTLPIGHWDSQQIKGFVVGAVLITLLGFLDDLESIDGKIKLFGQVTIIFFVVYAFDMRIPWVNNPLKFIPFFSNLGDLIFFPVWASVILSALWILTMTNTMNFVDGIDGLATSMVIVFSIVVGAVSIIFNQTVLLGIVLALLGCSLGFLIVNWHVARAFLGDGGSMLVGFCIGTLSILSGAKLATTLLVFGLIGLDILSTFIVRLRRNQSLFVADDEHIHYRLLKKGFSTSQVVLAISGISLLFGLLSLSNDTRFKVIALAVLFFVAVIIIILSRKP